MDDQIGRQAAITLPVMPKEHREYQTYNLDDAYEQGWLDLQKCIEKLPSAQPERCEDCENFSKTRLLIPQPDIIRCRDCKYGEQDDDGWWYCRDTGYSMGDGEKGDGFCSYAERKTDDDRNG